MRVTIDEYSKQFKISKEMIDSKIRTKELDATVEDGTTYIVVEESTPPQKSLALQPNKTKTAQASNSIQIEPKQKTTVAMVLSLYQRENQQLKEKILQLESKIDKLIDDKEQMLRDEMDRIETLYSSKDEQLKTILELINAQHHSKQSALESEIAPLKHSDTKSQTKAQLVELKEHLKSLNLDSYQKKIIKKRFLAVYDEDIRIIKQNGKLFLNFSKYDYSDLLKY